MASTVFGTRGMYTLAVRVADSTAISTRLGESVEVAKFFSGLAYDLRDLAEI